MTMYRQLWNLMAQQRRDDALKLAQTVIDAYFVEINAHLIAADIYSTSGNMERADFHHFVANGLLDSIKASGDGKTKATAFKVILVSEEYAPIVRSMGLTAVKVGTAIDTGHHFDIFTASDPKTGTQTDYYFNIDKEFGSQLAR